MNRELVEFQDALTAQKVASRYLAAASDTTTWDELYKKEPKLSALLKRSADRLVALADKVEDAVKEGKYPQALTLCEQAQEVAYKLFEPFRPMLAKGQAELSKANLSETAKQAKMLFDVVHDDLDRGYRAVGQVVQDKDGTKADEAVHKLALASAHVKNFYAQYVRAYSTRS